MMYSEEDVRSKVVLPWLKGQGFDLNEISLEHSFSIRAGKGVFRVRNSTISELECTTNAKDVSETVLRSRADILVKNSCGKNLLIIEVKAPNEVLDDAARDQGISYARLLDGNIAPFVVLTNGSDTKIFDSLSKNQITQNQKLTDLIPEEAELFLSCDELQLRAEAVATFISLSPQNLNAFCKSQIDFRMKLLKSNDLNSGRKYIPELYVERQREKNKLQNLLHEKNERVVLLVGSPQVGKTNFLCRMAEDRIAQGLPCLFYPAIGLKRGLFSELAEDFEWILQEFGITGVYVINKLKKVLDRSNQKLVVFIDGWNETSLEIARVLDTESEQLLSASIQIVVSLTNIAADRLLGGHGGNPSLLAQVAGVNQESAQLITAKSDAENPNWSLVNIHRYSEGERDRAYQIYSASYQVKIPETHNKISDPYILGAAMRLYQNKTLPNDLNEPQLLEKLLREKYSRAVDLTEYSLEPCLRSLAGEIYETDSPVENQRLLEIWKLPVVKSLPAGFFEAALLAPVTNKYNQPAIDFYYGKERDYIICYWLKCWYEKLRMGKDLSFEFAEAVRTNAGTDALSWFFRQTKHIELISSPQGDLPVYETTKVNYTLIYSICEIASSNNIANAKWMEYALDRVSNDPNSLIKIQAIKLFALLSKDEEDLSQIFDNYIHWEELISILLTVDDEFPIKAGSVGEIVIESLTSLHRMQIDYSDLEESEVSNALGSLMDHPVEEIRQRATHCLILISPVAFFRYLGVLIYSYELKNDPKLLEYEDDIISATSGLNEFFYGSYCPGFLDGVEDDEKGKKEIEEYYDKMREILLPIIKFYPHQKTIQALVDLLEHLKQRCDDEDNESTFIDRYTPWLPFNEE